MKLKKLLKDIPVQQIKGSKDVDITGICINSRVVCPGNLFIAKKGKTDDGTAYIQEAISGGAVAILTDIWDPTIKNAVQIIHPNIAAIEGKIAAEYYQHPSEELFTVGITGTNGKTTTSFMVRHLLSEPQGSCGVIGTIEYIIGRHRYQATHTTPDIHSNQKMLREMVLQGCHSAVMEVSSHALDQGRVSTIHFDVSVFTNLTLDHLDYHNTMEEYCSAKRKLFLGLTKKNKKKVKATKTAAINADSPWGKTMADGCQAEIISYGINNDADLRATEINLHASGSLFTLLFQGKTYCCKCPLIGRHNIYNYLAAAAVGLARNMPIESIIKKLESAPPVPGRLEAVPNERGLHIYVDFAHTDDALKNVLQCLRELTSGKLITVFGCGGDRDHLKRPLMARTAEEFSDLSIITSDNPRTEDPTKICQEIVKGFTQKDRYFVEIDRRTAIKKAVDLAGPEDVILIAGKGHEPYQIFAHKTIEFDDRKVASLACEKRENGCCV